MAEETAELTLEQELQQFYGKQDPGDEAKPGKETPKGKAQPAVETPAEEGEEELDPLEKLLKDIPDEEVKKEGEEKDETPQLSQEQQSILSVIPNAETAVNLIQQVQNYNNFTEAFEARKFDTVEMMFQQWDGASYDAFLEHLYQKFVATDGAWVSRFIAEQEGRGTEHKGMKSLEQKIAQLEGKLTERERGN